MDPRPLAAGAIFAAVPYAAVEHLVGHPLAGALATFLLAVSALVYEHVYRLRHERQLREAEIAARKAELAAQVEIQAEGTAPVPSAAPPDPLP